MAEPTNTGQPRMDEHSPSTIHDEPAQQMKSYAEVRKWMKTNHSPVNDTTSLHLHFLDYDDLETNVPETNVPETDVPETNVSETDVPEINVPETDLADKLSNDLKTLCQLTDGIFLTSGAGKIVRSALEKVQSDLNDFDIKESIAVAIPTMENWTELDGLDSFNHILRSDCEDVQGHLQARLISAAELGQTKPSICLMVGGGPQTLKRACYALERNIPIILMKGSRGLADLLVKGLADANDQDIEEHLQKLQCLVDKLKACEEERTRWDKMIERRRLEDELEACEERKTPWDERIERHPLKNRFEDYKARPTQFDWDGMIERQHVENELKDCEKHRTLWNKMIEWEKAKFCEVMKTRLEKNLKILETEMKGDEDEFYQKMKAQLEKDLKFVEWENKGDGAALYEHMDLRLKKYLEMSKSKMKGNAAKFFKKMKKRLEKDLERVKDATSGFEHWESKADDLKTLESALKEILRIPGSLEQHVMFYKMRHLVTVYNPTDDPQQEYLDTTIVKALMKCKKTAEVESILPSMLHRYKEGYQNRILCSRLHGYHKTEGEQTDEEQRNTYDQKGLTTW